MNQDFWQFEADFVESLRCIPMGVRFKLDTCGVKLKLSHWHSFTITERESLVNLPCNTPEEAIAYKEFLQTLVKEKTGEYAKELPIDPQPPWLNTASVPEDIQKKASEFNLHLTTSQWASLTPVQRFALIKLSRPSHENHNFYPALREFGIAINIT